MTDPDLRSVLGSQERTNLEFKQDLSNRDGIRKAICALSNDLGRQGMGHLLIGVDKRGNPTGVDTSDDVLLQVANIRNEAKILPLPVLTVDARHFAGTPCIVVRVVPSPQPPVQLDGIIYVRSGPTTRRATRDEERVLSERRLAADLPFDERPVAASGVEELDTELFRSTYLPAAVAAEVLVENERPVEHHLAALRMLEPESRRATVLGLLVIGFDPTSWVPGAYLQFVRYGGTDQLAPVVDEEELRGNLVNQLQTMDRLIRANVRTAVVETGGLVQQDRPDYPFGALREVILNAYAHRNYESSNAPIRVAWFDDRVEVTSPGGPFGAVTAENYGERNDYRNPGLAAALKHLGYVNRFGRGISLIRLLMQDNGNPPPEFQIDPSWWNVSMWAAA